MINAAVVARAAEIRRQFDAATPFRHVAIDDFLEAPACTALLRDFPAFSDAAATDEMGRTGRKAVVENVAGISDDYARFYAYINSAPFLAAMGELTGIPDLIADPTLFGGGTHEN
ncbi:MAG TPA: 2OG-Fe(II) oxygenase, partial [Rhodanobacteraceae bacterium]